MSDVLWRRLRYMLSPQFDIYRNLTPFIKNKSVLDVGCGTGFGTLQFLPYASSVRGVDIDKDAIEFCKETIPAIDFSVLDISNGILKRETFDVILMVEVLEHIQNWRQALKNVNELLEPDGIFIMTARNANADLRKNELHERELTAGELTVMLSEYFQDLKLYDYRLLVVEKDTHRTPLIAVCKRQK